MWRTWTKRCNLALFGAAGVMAGCLDAVESAGPALDAAASVVTAPVVRVTGGGTTTFGGDLDGDGEIDGSQFGFAAVIAPDGSASGHFTCLMAGKFDFLGLRLMSVQGRVAFGTADGRTFGGWADVKVLNAFGPGTRSIFRGIPFTVVVTPGGTGVATLQLTVHGVFDGVPGDTSPGNGDYDLATELLGSGRISISP